MIRTVALFSVLALSACVTADPLAPPPESAHLTEMRQTEHKCRDWTAAQLKRDASLGEAYTYFGQLPRESAKTYVVFVPHKGKGTRTAVCDSDTGEGTLEDGRKSATWFKRQFAAREKRHLASHKDELAPGEMSTGVVAVLERRGGAVKAREYWLPKHVEQEMNDLFWDTTGS